MNARDVGALVAPAVPTALGGAFSQEPWAPMVLAGLGVVLARTFFTSRQERMGERTPRREVLSVTGIALMIACSITWERRFGVTVASLFGIAVGLGTLQIMDLLRDRVIVWFGGKPKDPVMSDDELARRLSGTTPTPSDMIDLLDQADHPPRRRRRE